MGINGFSFKLTSHLRKIKSKAGLTGAPGVLYLWWIIWCLWTEKMNSFSFCLLLHSLHLSVLPLCCMFSQDSWEPCAVLLRFLSTGYFTGLPRCSLSFLTLLFAYFPLGFFSPALPQLALLSVVTEDTFSCAFPSSLCLASSLAPPAHEVHQWSFHWADVCWAYAISHACSGSSRSTGCFLLQSLPSSRGVWHIYLYIPTVAQACLLLFEGTSQWGSFLSPPPHL